MGDPQGFGRVEYAYHRMAVAAGIIMSPCHLLEKNDRAHFMTRRFDRDTQGGKIHMQSLCALGHYDFNAPGEYGYEQAFAVIQKLNLGHEALREMFRRMLFNVLARNQDDHTRNIAFLMDRQGKWTLAPAFDMVWAYNSQGAWTNRHQMSVNGKRNGFERADLMAVAEQFGIKGASEALRKAADAVARWPIFAKECGVNSSLLKKISETHRTTLAGK